jgi:hypothetical protein
MKYIKYFFKDLVIKATCEKRIVLIMCFSLSVTIAISFVLIKGLLFQIGDMDEINASKRSYSVVTECNIDDSRCVFTLNNIINNNKLPDITNCSGIYITSAQKNWDILAVTEYSDDTFTSEHKIKDGRWFSENEIITGEKVVVCNYEKFPKARVGNTVKLFGESFIVCGIAEDTEDIIADINVPYNTLVKLCENGNKDIRVTSALSIDFKNELTAEQKTELINTANKYVHQTDEVKSRFDMLFMGNVFECILYISLICVMFAFCIINVINLFRYFSLNNLYEYSILKICGSSNLFVMALMMLQSLVIICISYGIGLAFYFITVPLQENLGLGNSLNVYYYPMIFIFILVAMSLSYIPTIKKIATVSPVDKRLWR